MSVGALRLISLWPFPDDIFSAQATYLSVEFNYDGQLVREVQRTAPKGSRVHFFGQCGELPEIPTLLEMFQRLLDGQPIEAVQWEREAW
jgi:2-oxoglutarate ferredoxin oxidoreductase subunit alpha